MAALPGAGVRFGQVVAGLVGTEELDAIKARQLETYVAGRRAGHACEDGSYVCPPQSSAV